MEKERVAIFIDHNNVFHSIKYINSKFREYWVSKYDPQYLAEKIAGKRELVYIGFYCTPQSEVSIIGDESAKQKFFKTNNFFEQVARNPMLTVKHGYIRSIGLRRSRKEKNLDTQIVADCIVMAAFDEYDTAAFIGADGDYLSAIDYLRNKFNKRVEVWSFDIKNFTFVLKDICNKIGELKQRWFRLLIK